MPTLDRRMTPAFPDEALELFAQIERGPPEARRFYSDETRKLANLLDLGSEWWTGNSPADRREESHMPPWTCSYDDWHKCRGIRDELLAAASARGLIG